MWSTFLLTPPPIYSFPKQEDKKKKRKKKGEIKWLGWIGLVSVKVASCRAGGQPVVWNLSFNCKAAFSLSLRGHFIGVL